MTPAGKQKRPHGQIRQSQIVTTFGPGAMVDLPERAVIVGGLDHWRGVERQIFEERLAAKVDAFLGMQGVQLYAPPVDPQEPGGPPVTTGVTAWLFPEWFIAQYEQPRGDQVRSRPLLHREQLVEGKYFAPDRTKRPVVPVRFVQACIAGHISDIEWPAFAHREGAAPCRRQLWLDEHGTSGDLADIVVRCECGESRTLAFATQIDKKPLGSCRGRRPWLGPGSQANEKCGGESGAAQPNRLLVRAATNAYFPQVLSVISIPDRDEALRKAMDAVWADFLVYVEGLDDLRRERRKKRVHEALEGFKDETVLAEIVRRRAGGMGADKSVKQVEIEALLASQDEIGEDVPDGDFYARAMKLEGAGQGVLAPVERVVLVHRLREVVAQVGFTRFEAAVPDVDGELSLGVRTAALASEPKWVPAIENRGEGVFIAFRKDAIEKWRKSDAVKRREEELDRGFQAWLEAHPGSTAVFPGVAYVMLHSLSHLLITAVSLECGYAASAIRERVYGGTYGYGILLHTGTSDAEGALGGLVEVGRRIGRHLRAALELGRLCSNDPVCAQHQPASREEDRLLHGAACHGCLLIAETCCERRNELLDRALVVRTVEGSGAELFAEGPA